MKNDTSNSNITNQLYNYKAIIVKVIDGDTAEAKVTIRPGLVEDWTLRFLKINAPEIHTKNLDEKIKGEESHRFAEELLLNKEVIVYSEKMDSFGRWLSIIHLPGQDETINDMMLRLGLAKPFKG